MAEACEEMTISSNGVDLPLVNHGEGEIGIYEELGRLPPNTVVTEVGVARMFRRCTASIKAAVERGELPRPVRIMGKPTWTAGTITRHIEEMLQAEAKKFSRLRS